MREVHFEEHFDLEQETGLLENLLVQLHHLYHIQIRNQIPVPQGCQYCYYLQYCFHPVAVYQRKYFCQCFHSHIYRFLFYLQLIGLDFASLYIQLVSQDIELVPDWDTVSVIIHLTLLLPLPLLVLCLWACVVER